MLRLDMYVPPELVDHVTAILAELAGARHIVTGASTAEGLVTVAAEIDAGTADAIMERLRDLGIESTNVTLWRVPAIRPFGWTRRARAEESDVQVWAEIVGRADEHAKLATPYLIFMIAAGMIAGIGVLTGSAVLLVGAMAISPDLLPLSASAIGIVEQRWLLATRAIRVLLIGLGTGAVAAYATTLLLRLFGRVPDDLVVADTTIGEALTHLGPGSLMVAAAAGIAGIMAYERPGGAAVGVAISVTTIPAASYVGVAMAMGRDDPMWGAVWVLLTNLVMLLFAGTATLALQRRSRRRRAMVSAAPNRARG
jgi:uncharacterized hydrophobic protein (TIGR00271 family)